MIVDLLRHGGTDPRNLLQFIDISIDHSLGAAKMPQQFAAPLGADARNIFEQRFLPRFVATCTVAGYRETVRLIPYLLNQVKRPAVARQRCLSA